MTFVQQTGRDGPPLFFFIPYPLQCTDEVSPDAISYIYKKTRNTISVFVSGSCSGPILPPSSQSYSIYLGPKNWQKELQRKGLYFEKHTPISSCTTVIIISNCMGQRSEEQLRFMFCFIVNSNITKFFYKTKNLFLILLNIKIEDIFLHANSVCLFLLTSQIKDKKNIEGKLCL
jgi:hypothetical protein